VPRLSTPRRSAALDASPFLVLGENQFAYAAVTGLSEAPVTRACPIVTVHGPSGSGKSHLATHLVQTVGQQHPAVAVSHVLAGELAAEWGEAVRARSIRQFEEMYAGLKLLVCEDIQDLRNRTGVQEALIMLIDDLSSRGSRVLLTAAAPPGEISGLSPRLVNRCHGGVCVRIELPGRASRLKLLRHFAALQQIPVPLDVLEHISGYEPGSPRELRGALTQLVQQSSQSGQPVSLASAKGLQEADLAQADRPVAEIAREVARQFGVALRILRSTSRTSSAVVPRQAAMFLSRELTNAPYSAIGEYFAGRSHSTVVHACRRFEELLEHDSRLGAMAENVRRNLTRSPAGRQKPVDGFRKRRAAGHGRRGDQRVS
jgi:chromosomal replication initiator protein